MSLEPLNVLIGPNASGKSNLIEALVGTCTLRRGMYRCQRGRVGVCESGRGREMAGGIAIGDH